MNGRLEAALAELAAALRAEVSVNAVDAPDRLLSVEQAADHLGIGRTATYALVASGRLRSLKVGRRRLVPTSAVAAFINETALGDCNSPGLSMPAAIDADRQNRTTEPSRAERSATG